MVRLWRSTRSIKRSTAPTCWITSESSIHPWRCLLRLKSTSWIPSIKENGSRRQVSTCSVLAIPSWRCVRWRRGGASRPSKIYWWHSTGQREVRVISSWFSRCWPAAARSSKGGAMLWSTMRGWATLQESKGLYFRRCVWSTRSSAIR